MAHKTDTIELKVVKDIPSHIHLEPVELLEAEEGDVIGPFKILEKEEIPCDHEEIKWNIEDREAEIPDVKGICQSCDATLVLDSEEVKIVEEEDE